MVLSRNVHSGSLCIASRSLHSLLLFILADFYPLFHFPPTFPFNHLAWNGHCPDRGFSRGNQRAASVDFPVPRRLFFPSRLISCAAAAFVVFLLHALIPSCLLLLLSADPLSLPLSSPSIASAPVISSLPPLPLFQLSSFYRRVQSGMASPQPLHLLVSLRRRRPAARLNKRINVSDYASGTFPKRGRV